MLNRQLVCFLTAPLGNIWHFRIHAFVLCGNHSEVSSQLLLLETTER